MSFQSIHDMQAANFYLNTQVDPLTLVDLGPQWKGARLLVPVTVEAFVVTPAMDQLTWAETRLEEHRLQEQNDALPAHDAGPGEAVENVFPEPFATFRTSKRRQPGVHLHWALPDGLTRGRYQAAEDDTPLPEDASPDLVLHDTVSGGSVDYPFVPDRWLVFRIYDGGSAHAEGKRRWKAWVIEPRETLRQQGEVDHLNSTPLENWFEHDSGDRTMTAVGIADPAYMAYYDNARDILGFYDALDDGAFDARLSGPLTYVVMGWYGEPRDDPLYEPQTRQEWKLRMDELGFTVDGEALLRAAEAAEEVGERLGDLDEGGANASVTMIDKRLDIVYESFNPYEDMLASTDTLFREFFPRQMLCHGMIYDVFWRGGGGSYNPTPVSQNAVISNKPGQITIAVGNTGVEAMAALLAKQTTVKDNERILAAFHYGLLSELARAGGGPVLDGLLHAEDFESMPGGFVVDHIEQGDYFPSEDIQPIDEDQEEITAAMPGPGDVAMEFIPYSPFERGKIVLSDEGVFNRVDMLRAGLNRNDLYSVVNQERFETLFNPRDTVAVTRAQPRFYKPKDPVVLLAGTKRSMKHGEDGRFDSQGRLLCRLTGDAVRAMFAVVGYIDADDPADRQLLPGYFAGDLLASPPPLGRVPYEVREVLRETLLLDEASAPYIAAALEPARQFIGEFRDMGVVVLGDRAGDPDQVTVIRAEQTRIWGIYPYGFNEQFFGEAAGDQPSDFVGLIPSKVGVQVWVQPWTPLHLDWEVDYISTTDTVSNWALDEVDFELHGIETVDDLEALLGTTETYRGRTLLTPGVAETLRNRIEKLLQEDPEGDPGEATGAQEQSLHNIVTALKSVDVLATSLGGFHDLLVGLQETHQIEIAREITLDDESRTVTPQEHVFPVRAGFMRVRRLRVVDAFGQFVDIDLVTDTAAQDAMTVAEDMCIPSRPDLMLLPPRVVAPSRFMFRLLDAAHDALEATKARNPICGWIVPDHLDEAIEVYDAAGTSLGQVQLQADLAGQEWFGAPGLSSSLQSQPNLPNVHLQRFVQGMLDWSIQDALHGQQVLDTQDTAFPVAPRESALSALLRMVDATGWTVDPLGREGSEHLSVLIGRPLALVRAKLELEIRDYPPEFAHLQDIDYSTFGVRLGLLTDLYDGLMGYFVDDAYDTFYPVHESLAQKVKHNRRLDGFLSPIHLVGDYFSTAFEDGGEIDPVTHPYIDQSPLVPVTPGQPTMLTLLIDPRGSVHCTSGFLPRKRIDLMREHVADPLAKMALTFRIGPILTDPQTVRMPLPSEIRGGWSWVRRTGVITLDENDEMTMWEERDIVNAVPDALLPPTPATIAEGWLKLSSALGDEPGSP